MLLFFMARGNITKLRDEPWWKFHVHRQRPEYDQASNRIPYTMLVYVLSLFLSSSIILTEVQVCTLVLPARPSAERRSLDPAQGATKRRRITHSLRCHVLCLLDLQPQRNLQRHLVLLHSFGFTFV
jgi:hypothetical protein